MNLFDIEEAKNQSNKKLRISELEKLIEKYQKSYYNGEAEISDSEFDSLWDELKILDPNNAILHKVGADSGNCRIHAAGKGAAHLCQMQSDTDRLRQGARTAGQSGLYRRGIWPRAL